MASNIKHKHCAICLIEFDMNYNRNDRILCEYCRGVACSIRKGKKFKINVLNDVIRYDKGVISEKKG